MCCLLRQKQKQIDVKIQFIQKLTLSFAFSMYITVSFIYNLQLGILQYQRVHITTRRFLNKSVYAYIL